MSRKPVPGATYERQRRKRAMANLVDLDLLEKVFQGIWDFLVVARFNEPAQEAKRTSIIAGLQHDLARIRELK
jgi:hypothetical protein